MSSKVQMPSPKAVISTVASVAATAMVVRSVARDLIPHEFQQYISMKLRQFFSNFSNQLTLIIEEYDGLNHNHLFQAAEVYLGTIISPSTKRIKITKPHKENKITLSMEKNEQLKDTFSGFDLQWRFICTQVQSKYVPDHEYGSALKSELRSFELSFHKRNKKTVMEGYLPWVLEKSKLMSEQKKTLKLFTLKRDRVIRSGPNNPWQSVNLDHPATFDKLAMDWEAKKAVMEDLGRFVERKEFYRRVGKAWKRGYLLFGPPGTGKSSLIAAMANHLNFDVYDLELSEIRSNGELRNLLISTANQSILVVEDIDCAVELPDRQGGVGGGAGRNAGWVYDSFGRKTQGEKITLSGLLNFIDGLWSSCGDERIIVFTTNHKEKLDPALLRPGRMDVHIHMSYCTPSGFKMLASTYLGINDHPLLAEVEKLIDIKKVTPAEVGEQLLKNEGVENALKGLIKFLEEIEEIDEVEEKTQSSLLGIEEMTERKEDGKTQK